MGLAAAKTAAPAAAETLDAQTRRVSVRPLEAVLARKSCECGAAAGLSGRCETCAGVSLHMPHGQRLGGDWRAFEAPAAQATPPPAAASQFALRDLRAAPALKPIVAQTQLRVASAGDSAEVEAQEIGRRIVAMPAPPQESGGESRSSPSPVRRVISGAVQRRAIQPMMASPGVVKGIESTRSGGAPLPQPVCKFMEPRFGADFSSVRVHAGPDAAHLSNQLNAHAFTIGRDIYFNEGQFRPETDAGRELIAHELTHTIQQGGAIQRAAAEAPVAERSGESVQRSIWDDIKSGAAGVVNALGDPLTFLADKANMIPGFRLLTIVLGANPITMAKVDPTPANILMAMIEFIPGGGLVTQALQNSGVFDKVGNWIAGKIKALVATVGALKAAVTTFIGTLQAADIANPGGVWERAKRIFTEPIGQLIAFCKGVITDILKFIKDAILLPLAKLAEGTPSWDILCAVLGTNPVTGEAVEAKPEVLIGGFMKLIGQEEIWQNMQKANAIPRAFAWFKGAYGAVKAFVTAIPGKFKELFSSLTIEDVVLVVGAFKKVASVFGGFVGNFISWGLNAAWNLLEIIFDVVSPGAFAYVKKTGAALHDILKNPLPFVGNLVKAAKLGFTNFASNIGDHLKAGLIDWLTGSLPGVYIPKAFTLPEFGKLAISVLGLSWAQIRAKIVKALGPKGETIMKGLELAFDVVKALVTGGVAAAWELVKEKLTGLKDMVIDAILGFVKSAIIEKAIPKLIAMFVPGAGFISAIVSIYDTVKVFIEKLAKIAAVVKSFVDSIVAIAAGEIGGAAKRVEGALGGLLSLAISFFAGFVGLGNVASKVQEAIKKVWDMVDKGLDMAIGFIIGKAKGLFAALFGGAEADKPDDRSPQAKLNDLRQGIAEGTELLKINKQKPSEVSKKLPQIQKKYRLSSLSLVTVVKDDGKQKSHIHGAVNPELDGGDIDSEADNDNELDPQSIWDEVIGAPDAAKAETKLDATSTIHARQQIVGIFAANNVPAAAADSALDTIDSLLKAALAETTGDGITNRMASVGGLANQALTLGGTGTVINAHHIQQVAKNRGTYPATAAKRMPIPAQYKKAINQWVDEQTKKGVKGLKAKKEELVSLLRAQLFESGFPKLPPPLAEVEMVITTARAHREGHSAMSREEKEKEAGEITAPKSAEARK